MAFSINLTHTNPYHGKVIQAILREMACLEGQFWLHRSKTKNYEQILVLLTETNHIIKCKTMN